MYRWPRYRFYREPKRWNRWTAGLLGGAIGMMVVGALWYVRSQPRSLQQRPKQRALPRHGQAPSRSHVQMTSHPARQV
jgi:hypothetical protein